MASSGIDTLLINPNTQKVWYPSKSLESALQGYRRGDRDFLRRVASATVGLTPRQAEETIDDLILIYDLYLDLAEAKVDWLAEAAQACRQNRISPWLSYRMNDTHGSGNPGSPDNCRLFRQAKFRLSGRIPDATGSVRSGWIGLNYGRREVRDYMLEMVREGVDAYDYEGLELDWLRHPVCLEWPASQRQIEMMTNWFGELSALARSRRPVFPVGLRAPANLAYLKAIGIDVKSLVERGLIDFVTFSNFWQTAWEMPFDALRRELGPDVVLYGGVEDAPNWLVTRAPALTKRNNSYQAAASWSATTSSSPPTTSRARANRAAAPSRCGARGICPPALSSSGPMQPGNSSPGVRGSSSSSISTSASITVRVLGQRANYAALRGPRPTWSALRERKRRNSMPLNTASRVQPRERSGTSRSSFPSVCRPGIGANFGCRCARSPPDRGCN